MSNDNDEPDEIALDHAYDSGREEVLQAFVNWLEGVDSVEWLAHVVEYINDDKCNCFIDVENGNVYCDIWQTPTEDELKKRAEQRRREEAWEAVRAASNKAFKEEVAKYQEMGWLPE